MFNKFKILNLIPARQNFSGLKNKNQKKINGLKLFEIVILTSKKSKSTYPTFTIFNAKIFL